MGFKGDMPERIRPPEKDDRYSIDNFLYLLRKMLYKPNVSPLPSGI